MKHALAIAGSLLAAALFAALLIGAETFTLLTLAIGLIVLPVGYLLISALSPARPDRKCPECGAEALTPLAPSSQIGVRCTACGHRDEEASTALLDHEPLL